MLRLEEMAARDCPAVSWWFLPDTVGQAVLMIASDRGYYPVAVAVGDPASVPAAVIQSRAEEIAAIPPSIYAQSPVYGTFGAPITASPDLKSESGSILPGNPPRPIDNYNAQVVWNNAEGRPHDVVEFGWPPAEPENGFNAPLYEEGHAVSLLHGTWVNSGTFSGLGGSPAWLAIHAADVADGAVAAVGFNAGWYTERPEEWFAWGLYEIWTTGAAPSARDDTFLVPLSGG